ncbi:tRNA(Ile)-lysidine synthase [Anaerohalosphaera lusitana]|uniref:tRNA(Ile)-lysidine synthase n=1 Tax=Anaerohalosphaera lusitana TaxID=1936003 RepID=A0A1U9NI94_9BACT|nr:tRNA lysidine(34) synthetase TilS [Anaerohalosphaera lusitana]AQT67641.1 tRNA(Ile)-lysidine synthase [Anaerohalosphaera lusitana]
MNEFERKIADFVRSEGLIGAGERVLAAVSGGADSVALLRVLQAMRDEGAEFEVAVGHVNHNLRGAASDGDEAFVKVLAERMGVEVRSESVDTVGHAKKHRVSTETAARRLRMEGLGRMADELGCGLIATAHHMDDNAETVVHRLMRGTGYRGLGGIWPRKVFGSGRRYVRPLLCVRRREIVDYCTDKGVEWRHDHTNDELVYTRNRIRHAVLPGLEAESEGDLVRELFGLSTAARGMTERIEREAKRCWGRIVRAESGDRVVMDRAGFAELTRGVRQAVARRAIVRIGCGERDITRVHYESIFELAGNASGRIELPGGYEVVSEGDMVVFGKVREQREAVHPARQVLAVEGVTQFGIWEIRAEVLGADEVDMAAVEGNADRRVEYFDADRVEGEIMVRCREDGDRFRPIWGRGVKKVGKFLTDLKANERERGEVVVFEDSEGDILWVGPLRASEKAKVRADTRRVLRVEMDRAGQK